MLPLLSSARVAVLLLLSLAAVVVGDDTKLPAVNLQIAAADQLYRAGKFAEAETTYQALLKNDARLVLGGRLAVHLIRRPSHP